MAGLRANLAAGSAAGGGFLSPSGVIDERKIAESAEKVRAARFTGRLNELKLQEGERQLARQEQKRAIFSGALDPGTGTLDPSAVRTGLAGAGLAQELIDFNKAQRIVEQDKVEIDKVAAEARGEDLDNALAQANLIGTGSIGLMEGFNKLAVQDGLGREAAIQQLQPLYNRVRRQWITQGVDKDAAPDVFDPEFFTAAILSSKDAVDTFTAAKAAGEKKKIAFTAGTEEISAELFDISFGDATKEQRSVVKKVQQNRKRSVAASTGLAAEKARATATAKTLVTGKSVEAAGKAAGIEVAIDNIKHLRSLVLDEKGDIRKLNVLKSKLGVGVGRTINFLTEDTLASRLRLESGAVISEEELNEMTDRFSISITPGFADSKELANLKMDKLEAFLRTADKYIDPSGIFKFADFNKDFPRDLGPAIQGEAPAPRGAAPAQAGVPAGGGTVESIDAEIAEIDRLLEGQ
jgi:hypothetical protein